MLILADTYLSWRQRQYIFEGAEEIYDPDDDEDGDTSSSSSDSSSNCSSAVDEVITRDKEVDDELQQISTNNSKQTPMISSVPSTLINNELKADGDKSN